MSDCKTNEYVNPVDGACAACDSTCNKCESNSKSSCTSCRSTEFMFATDIQAKTFKCVKECSSSDIQQIKGKRYQFCRKKVTVDKYGQYLAPTQDKHLTNDSPHIRAEREGAGDASVFIFLIIIVVVIVILLSAMSAVIAYLFLRLKKSERIIQSGTGHLLLTSAVKNSQISIPMSDLDWDSRKRIGGGNFGEVFKCKYIPGNVDVAVKVFKPGGSMTTLYNEIGALCEVRHPHITKIIGTNFQDNVMLILPLRKTDLFRLLNDNPKSVEISDLHRFAAQISDAMMYLHSKNIIHCDLKAQNILIKEDFFVEVADFGLADFGDNHQNVGGTLNHMALEYLDGSQKTPHEPGDVWAYGVLIWHMFSFCRFAPYEDKGIKTHLQMLQFLSEGGRLSQPARLENNLWLEIQKCYLKNTADRPTFKHFYIKFARIYPMSTKRQTFEKKNDKLP